MSQPDLMIEFDDSVAGALRQQTPSTMIQNFPSLLGHFIYRKGDFKERTSLTIGQLGFQESSAPKIIGHQDNTWHHNVHEKKHPKDWVSLQLRDLTRIERFVPAAKSGFKAFMYGAALSTIAIATATFSVAALMQPSFQTLAPAAMGGIILGAEKYLGTFGKMTRHFHDAVAHASSTKIGLAASLVRLQGDTPPLDRTMSGSKSAFNLVKY